MKMPMNHGSTVEITINEKEADDAEEEGFEDWEVQSAYDCLCRAEEIKRNPDLMAAVSDMADKKYPAVIKTLKDLKKVAKKKIEEASNKPMMDMED